MQYSGRTDSTIKLITPWSVFSAALVVCLLLVGQFVIQDFRIRRTAELTDDLGRARDDFRLDFMHIALDKEPDTSWERERGAALLQQALGSYEQTLAELAKMDRRASLLAAQFEGLTRDVEIYSNPTGVTAQAENAEQDLRVLMFGVIESASSLDAQIRLELKRLVSTSRQIFTWSTVAAGILLVLLAYLLHRLQTTAERAARQFAESEERWRFALDGAGDGVWDWDVASHTVYYSNQWKAILGHEEDEIGNRENEWLSRLHPEDAPQVVEDLHAVMRGDVAVFSREHRMLCKNGDWAWILSRAKVVARSTDGAATRLIGMHTNITQSKNSEELIWKQKHYDSLTGLVNRKMFLDRLRQEVARSIGCGEPIGLIFIDLDRFKDLNESLGHGMGDSVLVETSRRIQRSVTGGDVVSRTGGDEFAVILSSIAETEDAEKIAERILKEVCRPIRIGSKTTSLSASVGLTLCPNDASDADLLFKNADQALAAAKATGRNRVQFYTPELQRQAVLRAMVTNELQLALENEQFSLVYQPIVHFKTGRVHKAEALVRWNHPTKGTINPALFIPIAESTGLIEPLGNWIFDEAVNVVKEWRNNFDPKFQLSVNKSPLQFKDDDIGDPPLIRLLKKFDLPGQSVIVEITEGLLLDPVPAVKRSLQSYLEFNVGVALDDFGTGFSSLSYLQRFDIDYIKIDRSFVSDLTPESKNHALCKAIVTMAHELGISVIAEGVESELQAYLLREADCDFGQGYFWGRPCSKVDFEKTFFSDNRELEGDRL